VRQTCLLEADGGSVTHLSYPHHIPVAPSVCALSSLFVEVMGVWGYDGMCGMCDVGM
jgi:hypothetical protein